MCFYVVMEMCERLVVFGIGFNLVIYLVINFYFLMVFFVNIVMNYLGIVYLMCLFGGYIVDIYIGCFCIIFFGVVF